MTGIVASLYAGFSEPLIESSTEVLHETKPLSDSINMESETGCGLQFMNKFITRVSKYTLN